MSDFLRIVGDELRRARQDAGLALRDLNRRSDREFKASAVGGYERGERSISLDRFCRLAALYGIAPEHLLGRVLEKIPAPAGDVVIDIRSVQEAMTVQAVTGSEAPGLVPGAAQPTT